MGCSREKYIVAHTIVLSNMSCGPDGTPFGGGPLTSAWGSLSQKAFFCPIQADQQAKPHVCMPRSVWVSFSFLKGAHRHERRVFFSPSHPGFFLSCKCSKCKTDKNTQEQILTTAFIYVKYISYLYMLFHFHHIVACHKMVVSQKTMQTLESCTTCPRVGRPPIRRNCFHVSHRTHFLFHCMTIIS